MTTPLSARPRLRVPSTARAGDIIEIRTLIDHPMETGLRKDGAGRPIARDMLARFTARANGAEVFSAEFRNGTSANPTLTFHARIERTTEFELVWQHEDGRTVSASARVAVA